MAFRFAVVLILASIVSLMHGCDKGPEKEPIHIRVVCGPMIAPHFEGEATEGTAEFDALVRRADEDKSCLLKQTNLPE